ncbi:MAG: hypothetical protein RDV41_04355 [Planctomycetota bacterium]|nr:hypothetical protein [Planctomycetota bacterium]
MAILELKSARGWSLTQAADRFFIEPATVTSWLQVVNGGGPDSLVQIQTPVNKFPDFVGHLVRRLKVLCPALGKAKIAQFLGRAGLHLAASSVRRMLRQEPTKPDKPAGCKDESNRQLTAKCPDRLHHVDMTVVPTSLGMWVSWLPFALPQVWPFCWWVVAVLDHFSRRCAGVEVFKKPPVSVQIRAFLGRIFGKVKPKYLVCDKGRQFWCTGFPSSRVRSTLYT